jgi:hypothetical protein
VHGMCLLSQVRPKESGLRWRPQVSRSPARDVVNGAHLPWQSFGKTSSVSLPEKAETTLERNSEPQPNRAPAIHAFLSKGIDQFSEVRIGEYIVWVNDYFLRARIYSHEEVAE